MKVLLFVIVILLPEITFAWGKEGHHIVALIAKSQLIPDVEKQVSKLLGDESFEQASVWMDEMRADHRFDFMKTWHYVNIENDEKYIKAEEGDLVSELQKIISELQYFPTMEKEEIRTDLRKLFHLCGDITQPLHTGYGSDKGGNQFKIKLQDTHTNLHHLWDTDIIINEKITTETCLEVLSKWTDKEKNKYRKMNVMEWMLDSRTLLFSVYNLKDKKITDDYLRISKDQIESQLIKGGLRLASVLNDIFSEKNK